MSEGAGIGLFPERGRFDRLLEKGDAMRVGESYKESRPGGRSYISPQLKNGTEVRKSINLMFRVLRSVWMEIVWSGQDGRLGEFGRAGALPTD